MKTVLTIAGFDPSSGAGVTADLMVFAAHGLFGTSCITALTVQSTLGVKEMHPVDAGIVRATLEHLHEDLPPAGVKIGMLATAETAATVVDYLASHPEILVVLDPVLRSSSGRELLSDEGKVHLQKELMPLVDWITPNLDELSTLTGLPVTTHEEMEAAAYALQRAYGGVTVFATGGHLEQPDDLLLEPDGEAIWIEGEWIATRSTHGTGCALSSALLSRLVLGEGARMAAVGAKKYVTEALRSAPGVGHGKGPLNLLQAVRKS